MREPPFTSLRSTLKAYPHIGTLGDPKMDDRFRVFPIMDVDGDSRSFGPYRTGGMFSGCALAGYIMPIYNDPNMDRVMEEIGYGRITTRKTALYSELFDAMSDPLEFYDRLRACGSTNMDLFVRHILNRVPEYQSRLSARPVQRINTGSP